MSWTRIAIKIKPPAMPSTPDMRLVAKTLTRIQTVTLKVLVKQGHNDE